MKKKIRPTAHKNENTFRFQTFAERLASINASVIHQTVRTSETPGPSETFFAEALEKWEHLNYTEDYDELQRDLGRDIYTLPQLVFHQERIVRVLSNHIKATSNALPPVLELLVALARDLQMDFYPHFLSIFSSLLDLLNIHDAVILEHVFSSVAYFFKYLWKSIVLDIKPFFRLYSPLLCSRQKLYLRNFAAESFSFIVRKVPNKKKIISILLKNLRKNRTHAKGTGQLLFEVMKGVKNQLHSSAENVLSLILEVITSSEETKFPAEEVEEAILECSKSMAKHVTPQHCTVIWKVYLGTLLKIQEQCNGNQDQSKNFLCILTVFFPFVEHKEPSLLQNPSLIFNALINLLEIPDLSVSCISKVLDILRYILQSTCVSVDRNDIVQFFSKLFKIKIPFPMVGEFIKKFFHQKFFEKDVFPLLLVHCEKNVESYSADVLDVLSSLILSTSDINGNSTYNIDLSCACLYLKGNWSNKEPCNKDISTSGNLLYLVIQSLLDVPTEPKFSDRIPLAWSALICLPYLKLDSLQYDDTQKKLQQLAQSILGILLNDNFETARDRDSLAFVWTEIFSAAGKMKMKVIFEEIGTTSILELLKKFPSSVPVLHSAVLFFNEPGHNSTNDFEKLYEILKINLSSPYHMVRKLTLQVFTAFDLDLPVMNDGEKISDGPEMNVFWLCLEVEEVPADVLNIRQKLLCLQKLEYGRALTTIPNGKYQSAPVYYLIGVLYVNFSLLWSPVQELLKSYAINIKKAFWEIMTPHLQKCSLSCEDMLLHALDSGAQEESSKDTSLTNLFKTTYASKCEAGYQEPDIPNHRDILWKSMELFPEVAEQQNRDLVPLFLGFIQKEYCLVDSSISSTENIRVFAGCLDNLEDFENQTLEVENVQLAEESADKVQANSSELSIITENEIGSDVEASIVENQMESEDPEKSGLTSDIQKDSEHSLLQIPRKENVAQTRMKRKKATTKSLRCHLSVFSMFRNPRAMHRESELHQLYLQLLSHRDSKVQKLAFDCILTYGDKYLSAYKQNFYNLLDNKTFKTEIVLFSVDSEFGVIHENDRPKVLPVLMRFLYGKMLSKTGTNTSGRGNAHLRRSIVLRFLAGCSAKELNFFLELIFVPFKGLPLDALEVVKQMSSVVNLSSVLPLKQQLSLINTLDVVFVQLGSLITDLLPWMLKIVLAILTTTTTILDKREQVYTAYIPLIKRIRSLSIQRLVQFFTIFDSYPFTSIEIDAVFEAAVWPQLPRLIIEGLTNYSPLLKLVSIWSSNPRFFPLLGKYKELTGGETLSILPELMSLYTSPKAHISVINIISKVLENLLTFQDFSEEPADTEMAPSGPRIQVNSERKLEMAENSSFEELNCGSLLLLPHVPSILKRMQSLVQNVFKNSNRFLSSTELIILSRISEFVDDADQSSCLVKMLIMFLIKTKRRNQEVETSTLITVKNLITKPEDPAQFVRCMSSLFFTLHSRQSRTLLCAILEAISERSKIFHQTASIIKKLNSWNPKLMEEPDYMTRLEGFKEAQEYMMTETNDCLQDFILLVIHNCTYFVIHIDDPAIRDNSSYTLQKMSEMFAPLMNSNMDQFRLLVCDTLLERLKKGLYNKNETVRHEFAQIMSSLLRACGSYPGLQGLAQLCNEDIEIDFWESIKHIQFHRRARAMRRLSQSLGDGSLIIPPSSLAAFVLPLASAFLYDSAYSKHNSLVDAAIELIGSICGHLPWNRYQTSLMYYLGLLFKNAEQNKTTIKVVVAVLDAFHFDISKSRLMWNNKKIDHKLTKNTGDVEMVNDSEDKDGGNEASLEDVSSNETLDEEKATKIHETISKQLIPRLHRCLTQKTRRDEDHKLNQNQHPEDNEILRIPIALAMVKLLQKLPQRTINQNLPGVFLKVVQFLRSRADSIRTAARDTLSNIMVSLGPQYILIMLHEMKGSLLRGYQVHVMMFTIHAVLTNMMALFSVGDLDSCMDFLTKLCNEEIFGELSEEKEVDQIVGKLKEARSTKSFAVYQILAQFVSESCLEKLVSPLVEVLSSSISQKKVHKVQECFRHILLGLANNKNISEKSLLIFGHQYITCGLQDINNRINKNLKDSKKHLKEKRPDIFLIPVEPPRGITPAKTSSKTNSHVLMEFGLQILHFLLKRGKLLSSSQEHLEMLDPFVPILSNYLSGHDIKVITICLRCTTWMVKFPLPSLKAEIQKIVGNTFVLLNKHSGPGMGQGENFEMVVMCFKLLSTTLREVPYHQLTPDQLRVLLIYIDQDVHDHTRQATAFTLLKAIISRRLDSAELTGVMKKISEMAVISEHDNIRTQCRQALHLYLLEYPLGKQLDGHLGFFVVQLQYEYESGRTSALEMLNTIFTSFPLATLQKHSGLFLVPLSACLVNDTSSKCRQMASFCIKNLLSRLTDNDRSSLFLAVTSWLSDSNVSHRRLGAQLLGLFAETEQQEFEHRLDTVLPIFKEHLSPELYCTENVEEEELSNLDNFLYQLLSSLIKVISSCKGLLSEAQHQAKMCTIWEYVQKHLLHEHTWVRLSASQLFGMLFAANPVEDFIPACESVIENLKEPQDFYLLVDIKAKLRLLTSDFCTQLNGSSLSEAHSEQVVRNLVYLTKVIRRFPAEVRQRLPEVPLSVNWVFQRLRKEVNAEVALNPFCTYKRTSVFRWLAAVALDMDKEVQELLPGFLRLLCRELADSSKNLDPELKTLAQEVVDILKGIVGIEVYTREFVQAQTNLSRKKAKRKTEKAVDAVKNPEVYSRRKIKKNLKKQESRKRKQERLGGQSLKKKKPKLSDLVMFS